jgi:hypothetical protein
LRYDRHVITPQSINKANEEIDGLTDEQLDDAIDRLFDAQPDVEALLVSASKRQVRILERGLFLSFFVFKAFEVEYPGKAVKVEAEDLESVFDETSAWMAQLKRSGSVDNPPPEAEPVLMAYIIQNLNEPDGDGTPHASYEQHILLLMVKTVVLALTRAAARRSAEGTAIMDPKERENRLYALRKGVEALEASLDDPVKLQALFLEVLFDVLPAKRGAVLLSGPHATGDAEDFVSATYAERGCGLTEGFEVDAKTLKFVYAKREACMANDFMPALMCAPLITETETMIGVIYLDTSDLGTFEMEDLGALRAISRSAANLIQDSLDTEAGRP